MVTQHRWDDLMLFLAVLRAGSIKGAARELGINSSTVGRRLEIFEEAIDVTLFNRTPDGVVATAAALRLAVDAEEAEAAHLRFARSVSLVEAEVAGLIVLTGPPAVLDHLIAPSLSMLHAKHPALEVELIGSNAYVDLSRGGADIALRARRPEDENLTAWKIGDFESAVIGSDAVFGERRGVPLDELSFIQSGREMAHTPDAQWIERNAAERIVLRNSSVNGQLEAARRGVGVTVMPVPFAHMNNGLCEVPLLDPEERLGPLPTQPMYMVTATAVRHAPRIDATWQFLKELTLTFPTTRRKALVGKDGKHLRVVSNVS